MKIDVYIDFFKGNIVKKLLKLRTNYVRMDYRFPLKKNHLDILTVIVSLLYVFILLEKNNSHLKLYYFCNAENHMQ